MNLDTFEHCLCRDCYVGPQSSHPLWGECFAGSLYPRVIWLMTTLGSRLGVGLGPAAGLGPLIFLVSGWVQDLDLYPVTGLSSSEFILTRTIIV